MHHSGKKDSVYIMDLAVNGWERVPYRDADFPIFAGEGSLSRIRYDVLPMHWHEDIEFSIVLSGEMHMAVEDRRFTLRAGQCIMVNSNRMHCNYSLSGSDGRYQCVLIHPALFRANDKLYKKYVEPLLGDGAPSMRILDPHFAADYRLLESVRAIHAAYANAEIDWEMDANALAHAILRDLHALHNSSEPEEPNPRLISMRAMISFIHEQYSQNLTLADIAAVGNVSKSSCSAIFREYLQDTPITYLNACRIEESMRLLRETDMSITQIALAVGFSCQTYFSEVFHKRTELSPRDYRKKARSNP